MVSEDSDVLTLAQSTRLLLNYLDNKIGEFFSINNLAMELFSDDPFGNEKISNAIWIISIVPNAIDIREGTDGDSTVTLLLSSTKVLEYLGENHPQLWKEVEETEATSKPTKTTSKRTQIY